MKILLIDGQGGKLGKQLADAILKAVPNADIIAIGTNSIATSSMLKSGLIQAATGENPVIVNASKVDVIMGPIGIVIADSLLGEITPAMAVAIGQSDAVKILIPSSKCHNLVAGVSNQNMTELIDDAIKKLLALNI